MREVCIDLTPGRIQNAAKHRSGHCMSESNIDPFASEEITPAISAEWEAKRRVASALRELTEILVSSSPPVTALDALAERLEDATRGFDTLPRLAGRTAFAEAGGHGNFRQLAHELNPLSGMSNPLAPPLNVWLEEGSAHGRAKLGWAYEGPPGSVHGGVVAALFDQFMGIAQALGGQPGMTGTLSLRYHRRTPLHIELQLRGNLRRTEGRKTLVHAELWAEGILTAECEALFVRPVSGMPLRPQAPSGV
jgi:acyl-coenzyme A thioesterase PaaI-like protein